MADEEEVTGGEKNCMIGHFIHSIPHQNFLTCSNRDGCDIWVGKIGNT
jgi:hypothetical protein